MAERTTPAPTPTITSLVTPILALSARLRGQARLFLGVVVVVWLVLMLGILGATLSVATATALATESTAVNGLLAALLATIIGIGMASWTEQWCAHVLAYRVIDTIRLRMHRAIARLAPLGLARRRSGDTVSAAMSDAESLEWFYAHTAAQVTAGGLGCVTVSVCAAIWLGPTGLLLAIAQVVVIAIPILLLPRAIRQGDRLRAAISEMSADALAARTSARESVLLGRLDIVAGQAADGTRRIQRARRALALRSGIEQSLIEAAVVAVVLTALALSSRAAGAGSIDAAMIPVIVTLAAAGISPATAITGALGKLGETSAAARRVNDLIVSDGVRPRHDGPETAAPIEAGSVSIVDLTVQYPGADHAVVRGLNLEIAEGETLAVVGASGAGKSTLALVLARLIGEQAGRIVVGGVDVATESPERVREHIVLVGQHTHIFRASVRDNLLTPDADDEQIWSALRAARLADRVRLLPDGLDTVLAERGASWSGGERQRLGLARGLLRDPEVLVLDEPTAGLDARTEAEFLTALTAARRGATTIIVTHRTAVMRVCDRIAVLADGRIADSGRHLDLVTSSAPYRAVLGTADDLVPDIGSDERKEVNS